MAGLICKHLESNRRHPTTNFEANAGSQHRRHLSHQHKPTVEHPWFHMFFTCLQRDPLWSGQRWKQTVVSWGLNLYLRCVWWKPGDDVEAVGDFATLLCVSSRLLGKNCTQMCNGQFTNFQKNDLQQVSCTNAPTKLCLPCRLTGMPTNRGKKHFLLTKQLV